MTDKLTDKDIIKALPNMTYGGHYCAKCKYDNGKGNDRCGLKGCKIARYALDLITRQQAENENLKVKLQSMRSAANSLKMHYEEAQAEIDSLKIFRGYAEKRASDYRTMRDKYLNAKSEAVKEFTERLKDTFEHAYQFEYGYLISKDVINAKIDNLVKEMVGENNATT